MSDYRIVRKGGIIIHNHDRWHHHMLEGKEGESVYVGDRIYLDEEPPIFRNVTLTGIKAISMKDKTAPERVARDKQKKLAAGFVRVSLWVPAGERDRIVKYAARLRNGG